MVIGHFAPATYVVAAMILLQTACAARAQEPPAEAERADERVVAATVDGEPIYADQVEQAIAQAVGERTVTDETRLRLAAETLELLIKRRLALGYLEERGLAASDDDIRLAVARLERGLSEQRLTLAEFLDASGLSEAELRERYDWEIGWGRFLDRQLTDENLAAYFDRHRRQFDGTELKVAHILLVPAEPNDEVSLAVVREEAARLHEQIVQEELSFAEAAAEHSQAPTAAEGGELGWIGRRQPMPESFSVAAFELEPGEISPPAVTAFGVHLIECREVKPGERTWQDAREELEPAVSGYLLEFAADRRRPSAVVEYSGLVAYGGEIEPASDEP